MKVHCAFTKMIPIGDLKIHPKNRNKHPKSQVERLAEILKYQGWRFPIKVSNQSGFITAGHGRLLAAKMNGWTEAPVDFQDYESSDQEYADVQGDNAIASWANLDLSGINLDVPELGPDFNIDMLGIKNFSLDRSDKKEGADSLPEIEKTDIKLGDFFKLGIHYLLCGDATKEEDMKKLLGGGRVDLVYTDPPYGISVVKNSTVGTDGIHRVAPTGSYAPIVGDDSTDTAVRAFHVAKNFAHSLIFWGGNYYANELPPSKCWFVWDKREDSGIENTYADAEIAWTNLTGQTRIYRQLWNGMIRKGESEKRIHPTQKPVALAEWCFEKANATSVLDPFAGSGSTLIAAERTKRQCFAAEISPEYVDLIIRRWEMQTFQKAEKIN